MGLSDALRRLTGSRSGTQYPQDAPVITSFADQWQLRDEVMGLSPAEVWRTQPHLRTVVTFVARNVAQLGLQTFQRAGDNDRVRVRDGGMAATLARPNPNTTSFELVYGLVADLALYDVGYWHFAIDKNAPSGWSIYRLPPDWVTPQGGDAFGYDEYLVRVNGGASSVKIPAENVLAFHGWNPTDTRYGSSPVVALKSILAEQMMAVRHRQQVWERGGRVSAVITRPQGANWSPEARESFREDWKAKYAGDGPMAGGTPILEDGMTINRLDFNAHEQEFVEAAKLALSTVASVYHVNPTMIGVLDNANYSNVVEFRKGLYGDTLGPTLSMIEDRLNTFMVPTLDPRPNMYVEFNVSEKLRGSFVEQAQVLSTSTGGPWLSRNEARALSNLPAIDGADDLIVPLNVTEGGQASPADSGTQNLAAAPRVRVKAREKSQADAHEDQYRKSMERFFAKQEAVVKSRLGAKADADWWDTNRWNDDLANELSALHMKTSVAVAHATLAKAGLDPSVYDVKRTKNYIRAAAESAATSINETTQAQIVASFDADVPSDAVTGVFETAKTSRAAQIAVTAVTAMSSFGTVEAATQQNTEATKTWVTGANARPSHAVMDGEKVGIGDQFSNGLSWPGGFGDADEVAGCNCDVEVDF